ncbi:MAG: hypothetical protein KKC46_06080 [Proteobacteria bacterium]|nr:hypothetical protein [Pseudomonadota bacterium]
MSYWYDNLMIPYIRDLKTQFPEAQNVMLAGASGGKFILFSNNIKADTPPEHVHAFIAAVNAYGKYPISEHFDSVEVKIPKMESLESFVKMKIKDNPEGYTFSLIKDLIYCSTMQVWQPDLPFGKAQSTIAIGLLALICWG